MLKQVETSTRRTFSAGEWVKIVGRPSPAKVTRRNTNGQDARIPERLLRFLISKIVF